MSFEHIYGVWLDSELGKAEGGRLRKLEEGPGHAERAFLEFVWHPAFGHFDCLLPEFEVRDFKDGCRYVDFAYIRGGFRLAIEIDGFGPHWKEITREQFADQWVRQNDLIIDGWKVLRFAYDDIVHRPRRCQQAIHQLLGRWLGEYEEAAQTSLSLEEKEILRIAIGAAAKPLTPSMVAKGLGIGNEYAIKLLKGLIKKGVLAPAGGSARIRAYRLVRDTAGIVALGG